MTIIYHLSWKKFCLVNYLCKMNYLWNNVEFFVFQSICSNGRLNDLHTSPLSVSLCFKVVLTIPWCSRIATPDFSKIADISFSDNWLADRSNNWIVCFIKCALSLQVIWLCIYANRSGEEMSQVCKMIFVKVSLVLLMKNLKRQAYVWSLWRYISFAWYLTILALCYLLKPVF